LVVSDEDDALRNVWETDMEYRMAAIEQAEAKAELYQVIREAHQNGWTEEEIADYAGVKIGYVRAAIAELK
jgi:uncharacterized protein (DUF2267 family)